MGQEGEGITERGCSTMRKVNRSQESRWEGVPESGSSHSLHAGGQGFESPRLHQPSLISFVLSALSTLSKNSNP